METNYESSVGTSCNEFLAILTMFQHGFFPCRSTTINLINFVQNVFNAFHNCTCIDFVYALTEDFMNFGGYPFPANVALSATSSFLKVSSFVHIDVALLCRHLNIPPLVLSE
jgi:hypothetical protein